MSIARKYALRGAPGVDRCCCCSVLTWFGLLSPGKGIETTIVAVSQLVERHPEVLLVVAGRTHPGVVREQIVSGALTFAVAAGSCRLAMQRPLPTPSPRLSPRSP